jgi:hypothetical protein
MPKYRKKPIVIEAEQWFPDKNIEGVEEEYGSYYFGAGEWRTYKTGRHIINTLEGAHVVSPGDYIITGIAGEKYPCKEDIFKQTYEPYIEPHRYSPVDIPYKDDEEALVAG